MHPSEYYTTASGPTQVGLSQLAILRHTLYAGTAGIGNLPMLQAPCWPILQVPGLAPGMSLLHRVPLPGLTTSREVRVRGEAPEMSSEGGAVHTRAGGTQCCWLANLTRHQLEPLAVIQPRVTAVGAAMVTCSSCLYVVHLQRQCWCARWKQRGPRAWVECLPRLSSPVSCSRQAGGRAFCCDMCLQMR
jgi:hypothetical protein